MPFDSITMMVTYFILVHALMVGTNVISKVAELLLRLQETVVSNIFGTGILSALMSNVITDRMQVMILVKAMVENIGVVDPTSNLMQIFAVAIGFSVGTNLTLYGTVAGILLMQKIRHHDVGVNLKAYLKVSVLITVVTLLVSLGILWLEFMIF